MSEHYYTQNPTSLSNEREFKLSFMDAEYRFIYDNGVFSKGELDEGTALMLEAIDEVHGEVLDLGCGWGAVGTILGKRFEDARITMSDINERALDLSRKNLAMNGVKNARVVFSDGFDNIESTFDFIITNPPIRAGKQVIYSMFDEAIKRLNTNGKLILVIRKQQGALSALKHLEYANARIISKHKGFMVICAGGNENE